MRERSISELVQRLKHVEQKLERGNITAREQHVYLGLHRIYREELQESGARNEFYDALKWELNYNGFRKD